MGGRSPPGRITSSSIPLHLAVLASDTGDDAGLLGTNGKNGHVSSPSERLVILDCDGVLVDTERLSIEIDRHILAELGWDLTLDQIVERFLGRTHEYFLHEVESHTGRALQEEWDASYEHLYRDAFVRELQPVDGIVEALGLIRWPTCVASSGSHDKLRFTLGLTGLWQRFEGRIYSASEVAEGKPAPDLFLHAASRQGWEPDLCVVVEDSPHGVQAGLAAGMAVVAYSGGVAPAARLARDGVIVIDDMRDLPEVLAGL